MASDMMYRGPVKGSTMAFGAIDYVAYRYPVYPEQHPDQ